MLYLIGIGLADEQDIAIKGLGIVRRCQEVYMEDYTSIMQVPKKQLEEFYGSKIISAPRDFVENQSDLILKKAKIMDIALLVVGDPLMATTHTSLLLDAKKQGVPFKVVHNASVLNAVAQTGLQIYKFGKIASIPFHESDGPYQVLEENHKAGSHTLFLLDLDPKNNKMMTAAQAAQILLSLENKHKHQILSPLSTAIACARLGANDQLIRSGPLVQISQSDFGQAPHCLIIPGNLHFLEEEWLKELSKN